MTTLSLIDETLERFDRKSPRESYRQVCDELHVHMQNEIYSLLPETSLAWHRICTLDLQHCLLGPSGCMALLPIITVSTALRVLNLRSCGVADDFVQQLCNVFQNHTAIRAVDLGENPLITTYSAAPILALIRNNTNLVSCEVDGTHIGANVGNLINAVGARNRRAVAEYYQDKYFKLKNMFGYLDEDGVGWVSLKSLILSCPYPVLQEQLVERVARLRPQKRSDQTISLNTFLQLVYMNYKTEAEITQFAARGGDGDGVADEPFILIIHNWKQLLEAITRYNVNSKEEEHATIAVPDDLHRVRIRDIVLTNDLADDLVRLAVHSATMAAAEGSCATSSAAPAAEEHRQSGGGAVGARDFLKALRSSSFLSPPRPQALYRFFTDHELDYVPECLRNGSRLFSLERLSLLEGSTASFGSAPTETQVDPEDPIHTFALPSSVVRLVVSFFNCEAARLPKKKKTLVPESPRTRRDRAMERTAIPITSFLAAEFVTDLEVIKVRLLADYYARYGLPVEDCTITLQEMVNVLDEMYVECRVDRVLSVEAIKAMPDPAACPTHADFLKQRVAIQGRGEEDESYFYEPLAEL